MGRGSAPTMQSVHGDSRWHCGCSGEAMSEFLVGATLDSRSEMHLIAKVGTPSRSRYRGAILGSEG